MDLRGPLFLSHMYLSPLVLGMRLFTCAGYRVTHVILCSPQRNQHNLFRFLCHKAVSHRITLPTLATWIQLSGGVNRAMGELVVHTVTWVKHQTPGAPLSGPSTIKSQQSHPPGVVSHLAASLMDDDSLIMWLHFFPQKNHRSLN